MTKTISPIKKGPFLNTYAIYKQRWSFWGIDTYIFIQYGDIDHNSFSLYEAELIYVANRSDIISLMPTLVKRQKFKLTERQFC